MRYRVSLSGKPVTTQVGRARCCFFVYITAIPRVMVVQLSLSTSESAPFHVCTLNYLSTAPHAVDRPQASRSSGFNQKKVTQTGVPSLPNLQYNSSVETRSLLDSYLPLTLQSHPLCPIVGTATTRRVTQEPGCDDDGMPEPS